MNTKIIYVFSLLLVVFVSCYKDTVIIDNTDVVGKRYPKIKVDAEVAGRVHDEYGNDISGYTGSLLGSTYDAEKIEFNTSESGFYALAKP